MRRWWKKKYTSKRRLKRGKVYITRATKRRVIRRNYRVIRSSTTAKIEHTKVILKKKNLPTFHILASQLLVYNRSCPAVFSQIQKILQSIKKEYGASPIAYINMFFKKAIPRLFLRDYRVGKNRLKVPVPASFGKRRAAFLKQLLLDLRGRRESTFYLKFFNEIQDFNTKQGVTYLKKLDTYIISKQNRNYSRYAYKGKGYLKKNATKKNKFSFI